MIMTKLFNKQATDSYQRAVRKSHCLPTVILSSGRNPGGLYSHRLGGNIMNHKNHPFAGTLVMILFLFVSPVQAVTVNIDGSGNVTSILGFEPGGPFAGNKYNINFSVGTFADVNVTDDFIFLGDSNAVSFVFQLNQLLDSSSAVSVGGFTDYNIPDQDLGSDVNVITAIYNLNSDDLWGQTNTNLFGKSGVIANWAVVSQVPIPPALWLFCTGFMGLIGVARRKKTL